jgi:hypothetical protein
VAGRIRWPGSPRHDAGRRRRAGAGDRAAACDDAGTCDGVAGCAIGAALPLIAPDSLQTTHISLVRGART